MSNIHGFSNFPNNTNPRPLGISSSTSNSSGKDDRLYDPSSYRIRTVTFWLMASNIAFFIIELLAFYLYYTKKNMSWLCCLTSLGSFQPGKIVNHYQYSRFLSSMFLHSSKIHLGSNMLSLFFLGFQVEGELKDKKQFAILYFISGFHGNFLSMLFNVKSFSVGASGAIIGLCGNFVIYFLLNYRNMSDRKKYSYGFMFVTLFFNLFSGLSEGGKNINMYAHIGGFLGGLAYSSILIYKKNPGYRSNSFVRKIYYSAIAFLIALPVITLVVVNFKKVPNIGDYVCKIKI